MATDSRDAILSRWRAAKKADPKLTRADFMMKGSPGKYKNRESAAAYLRVLESGKRSGSQLWARSRETPPGGQADLYQVSVPRGRGRAPASFDLEVVHGGSSFDVPLVETRLKEDRQALLSKQRAWATRYDIDLGDIDIDDISVRRVRRHKKHSLRIAI